MDDVRAAIEWLDREFRLPIIFAGFSFGAAVGLRAACPDPRVAALISLGTPAEVADQAYGFEFLLRCPKPKLFVSGAQDQYGPRGALQNLVARAAEPKQLVLIEGADHFFEGHLKEMGYIIADWLDTQLQSHRL